MTYLKLKKDISSKEALQKMASFCAYQERTQQEVRNKLQENYTLSLEEIETVISELIIQNFLNEERFAIVYAGSKLRVNKWGKIKIRLHLKAKGLSEYCVSQALKAISDEEYETVLQDILQKKHGSLKALPSVQRKQKLMAFAISKGFEPDIVREIVQSESF